jgi:PD-(D/E)XK nuclease superfamily
MHKNRGKMSDFEISMSLSELRSEIVKFNNDPIAQRLRQYYNEKTYPEIMGVSRRELSHSSFLAWILNPNESHGINDFGIRRLLEILMTSKFWYIDKVFQNTFDNIITGNFHFSSTKIFREYKIGFSGRLDILAELEVISNSSKSKIRIIIENKVLSTEGQDQTNRYYSFFSEKNDDFINVYVYLTPISSLDLDDLNESECENKNFIQINYQEIVDSLLEPVVMQNISENTRIIVNQYIQSLSQPSFDNEENDFERGMIMAIGREERELLQKFWNGNQKVIQAALYAISSDPNQEKEVRDTVRDALSSIATTGKDRSSVLIRYEGIDHISIRKSDIGYETIRLLESKGYLNDNVIQWLSEDNSSSHKLIKTKSEIQDYEANSSKYRVNQNPELTYKNVGYYIARNWGIGNIGKFIAKIEAKFPKISYIIEK